MGKSAESGMAAQQQQADPSAADIRAEMARIDVVLDQFTAVVRHRLHKKVREGYQGWDHGYPSKDLEDEILQDSADMRGPTVLETVRRKLLIDIAARSLMLWWRSRRMTSEEDQ